VENPWLRYSLLRLGLFFALFLLFRLMSFDWLFSALVAALVSFALSLLFLDRERDRLSEVIHNRFSRNKEGTYSDEESDLENEILDSKQADSDQAAEKPASKRGQRKSDSQQEGESEGS
jgi:hypothetical protein